MTEAEDDLDFNVGLVGVTLRAGSVAFDGVPVAARGAGTVERGMLREAEFATSDGLRMIVGFVTWPSGTTDVQPLDFLTGPKEYQRLERAGRMSLSDAGTGTFVVLLRALKQAEREWPSLATVTWEDLDALSKTDARRSFSQHTVRCVPALTVNSSRQRASTTTPRRSKSVWTTPKQSSPRSR